MLASSEFALTMRINGLGRLQVNTIVLAAFPLVLYAILFGVLARDGLILEEFVIAEVVALLIYAFALLVVTEVVTETVIWRKLRRL